ncbi:MAG: FIST N-terminal domain-containing protein [Paracoccus sp. (in: a-proteobacteria)]|uniref:FIST N-terminal domain-containing protein n=1 Tax=Paracoccus sp. TaxID=267 RepID=UPI0026E10BC0|nr:FIST N-terminal domain-containing protein [Paracoccus sp. (in: a-proteobacteria)]MDO5612759.1 FIST N-terminal domain-containing protein [Paracoccus sp. (in: a-proteobacteria)]
MTAAMPAPGPVMVQVRADAPDAAAQIAAGVAGCDPALVLIFGPPGPAFEAIAHGLRARLPSGCSIAGCSSAGEIGPQGYVTGCVVAVAFPSASFRARALVLRDLPQLPVSDWMAELRRMQAAFGADPRRNTFGILLPDGLAGKEDVLVATIEAALPALPVLGGSAGDGLEFRRTMLIADGLVTTDAAVFLMVETDLSLAEVTFAHFSPSDTLAVVTAAVPEQRLILELNAEPAAAEYARLTGIAQADLTPTEFARHPLLLKTGKRHHVRAISGTTPQGGLSLLSAIDTGTVLRLGRAEDLIHGFADALDRLPRPPLMVLGFDCILRRLAIERAGLTDAMSDMFTRYRIAGFSTYGEQHSGMHVNQTFVGLAFLPPPDAADPAGASDAA